MPPAPTNQGPINFATGLNLKPASSPVGGILSQPTNTGAAGLLTAASRTKLDGIVQQMQTNGETDDYIQGVVNDFKQKYAASPNIKPPLGAGTNGVNINTPLNDIAGFIKNAGSQIGQAASQGVGQIGSGLSQAANPGQAAGNLPLGLLRAGAGAVNAVLSPLAPVMSPVGGAIAGIANKISDIPVVQDFAQSKLGNFTSKATEGLGNAATIAGALTIDGGLKPTPNVALSKMSLPELTTYIKGEVPGLPHGIATDIAQRAQMSGKPISGFIKDATSKLPQGSLQTGLNGVEPKVKVPMTTPLGDFARNSGSKVRDAADKGITGFTDATSGTINKVSEITGKAKTSLLGTPEERFNKNLNKALPVLKKDVKNLPQKQAAARSALGDIVANKDKTGVVDSDGNPKVPSTFAETVQAQTARMKDIYQQYTARLSTVDASQFASDIRGKISSQIQSVKNQLSSKNLTTDGRRALGKISNELSELKDYSPQGIQDYIEQINQEIKTAPGSPMTTQQIKYANLGGELRGALDSSIDKLDGQGYQDLRNLYGAHRQIESQLLMAAKKEINNVPGLTDKLTTLGLTVEGVSFLLSHNPASLALAAGTKGASMLIKYLNSPQTALGKLYKSLEESQSNQPSNLAMPQTTSAVANASSMNSIPSKISSSVGSASEVPDVAKGKQMSMGSYKAVTNPNTGRIGIGGYRKPGVNFYTLKKK